MKGLWKVLCGVLCAIGIDSSAQLPAQHTIRVSFKDKSGSPAANLSQRALDRRSNKGIVLDSTDKPVSPVYITNILTLTGGKLHVTSRWLNTAVILVEDTTNVLTDLQALPYVAKAERVGYYPSGLHKTTPASNETGTETTEGPTAQLKTTGTEAYYGATYTQTKMVSGDYLHDRGYRGEGMLIAILDDGFYYTNTGIAFDSMNISGRLVDAHNFPRNMTDVYASPNGGHGTRCLSTMAGYIPGVYVGSAPLAQYALYVTEDLTGDQPVEMDNMVAGLERADSIGADVISASIGYNGMNAPFPSVQLSEIDGKTTVAAQGVNMANNKGMFCVITAGNDGTSAWKKVLTPGDADSALTVGWVDQGKNPNPQSGFGPNAGGRRKPDVCLLGSNVAIMIANNPSQSEGTSLSTPQMAGWAACLLQASSKATSMYTLRTAIHKSAHLYNTPDDNQLGYGVPDFYKASEILNIPDTKETPVANKWVVVKTNPVATALRMNITMLQNGEAQVAIVDAGGKQVFSTTQKLSKGVQAVQIDMPELAGGIYFVKVIADGRQEVVKLVKN